MSSAEHRAALRGQPHDGDEALPCLAAELQQLENELRELVPSGGGLNRDRLLFEAGRASALAESRPAASASSWQWPAAAATMTAVAASLALALVVQQRGVETADRVRQVQVAEPREEPIEKEVEQPPTAPAEGLRELALTAPPQHFPPAAGRAEVRSARTDHHSIVPRAGARFRLFEHLLGESAQRRSGEPSSAANANGEVLSPRSLPDLLDHVSAGRPSA